MNFDDFKPKQDTTQLFFKTDWSEEEKAFRDGLPAFLKSIEQANPVVKAPKPNEEKNIEEKQEEKDGELIIKGSSNDTQQGQAKIPREKPVTDDEFLADFFGEEQAASPTAQAVPEADPAPKPTPKEEPAAEEDPFESPPITPNFPPEEPQGPEAEGAADPLMDGFDTALYDGRVKPIIDQILSKIPDIDVEASCKSLPEYALRLDLDKHREDPDKIADFMVKVQSFKDSVMTEIIGLGQALDLLKRAMEFALTNGVLCSKGSSREKRQAHVQFVASDLYVRLSEVTALYKAYEKTLGALSSQSDLLSRLLTTQQDRMRGMFKSTLKEPRDTAPAEHTTVAEEPAAMVEEPRKVPQQKTQVDADMTKLDDFDPSAKAESLVPDKFKKGEWDF